MNNKPSVKPLFHYVYKSQSFILDSQYNFQGSMLAVSNSNGQLYLYDSTKQQYGRQPLHHYPVLYNGSQLKKTNLPIIKIAWSHSNFSLLATAFVDKTIIIYKFDKGLNFQNEIYCNWVPYTLCFCPIDQKILLTVGYSNGSISIYDSSFSQICCVEAHQQCISSLSWQNRILNSFNNEWIMNSFSCLQENTSMFTYPLLLSSSSDLYLKIWKLEEDNLILLGQQKAHDKHIRQAQWKPNCFNDEVRKIISCSQDQYVRIWSVEVQNKKSVKIKKKTQRKFCGPVYKASYNYLGSLIAVSYKLKNDDKVQTRIMEQEKEILLQIDREKK